MKKTMLTFDLLVKFENEYITENYTDEQKRTIETDAKIAMFNRHCHLENNEEWTETDIFNDFLRILEIDKISVTPKTAEA